MSLKFQWSSPPHHALKRRVYSHTSLDPSHETDGTATSLSRVDTDYSADCVEFCPFEGYQDIFVCGTYQVLEPSVSAAPSGESSGSEGAIRDEEEDEVEAPAPKQTNRTGRLLLFQVDKEGGLSEIQRIETNAILDAKWYVHPCVS